MASQRCDIQAGHGAVRQDMAWPAGSGGLCDAALKKKPERLWGRSGKVTRIVTLAGDDRSYGRTDGKSMTFPTGPTSITG